MSDRMLKGSDHWAKAPFPYFGGKRNAAGAVWRALGDCEHYVEPFAGSLAVLLRRPHVPNRTYYSETVNDLDLYLCVDPGTRVLARDLSYRKAGDLKPGDELLAFDEENPGTASSFGAPSQYRRWRHSVVIAAPRVALPCYRLTFEDGTSVIASENHSWLGGTSKSGSKGWRWIKTRDLACNRTTKSCVLRVAPNVDLDESRDASWLSGLYDGEGCVFIGPGSRISLAQNPGNVLDRASSALRDRGFAFDRIVSKSSRCVSLTIRGGLSESLRFLMSIRPDRLVRKFHERLDELSIYGRKHGAVRLVRKEFLGEREVVALSTTTRTFIAEGLASHNCNFWRAVARHPEAVAQHASYPVSEVDLLSRHMALVRWASDPDVRNSLVRDPDRCYTQEAGWWVWGICAWIGHGWCSGTGPWHVDGNGQVTKQKRAPKGKGKREPGVSSQLPHLYDDGRGIHNAELREPGVHSKLPHLTSNGRGIHNAELREPGVDSKLPHLTGNGQGIQAPQLREPGVDSQLPHLTTDGRGIHNAELREPGVHSKLPHLFNDGRGIHAPQLREPGVQFHQMTMPKAVEWMQWLSARLRHVRILCGDWERALTPSASITLSVRRKGGISGVFLDPPYDMSVGRDAVYNHETDVSPAVRAWCLANGQDPKRRIVLAGFDTEHAELEQHGWTAVEWFKSGFLKGGMGQQSKAGHQMHRDRLWLSPHCLPIDGPETGNETEDDLDNDETEDDHE